MADINTYVGTHDLIPHRNEVFSSDMDAMIYRLYSLPTTSAELQALYIGCTLGISGSGRLQHYDSGCSSFVRKYV